MDQLIIRGRRWLYGVTFRLLRRAALGSATGGKTARRGTARQGACRATDCRVAQPLAGGGGPESSLGIAAQMRAAADVRGADRWHDDWGREL